MNNKKFHPKGMGREKAFVETGGITKYSNMQKRGNISKVLSFYTSSQWQKFSSLVYKTAFTTYALIDFSPLN